jgi:hypothetical protein
VPSTQVLFTFELDYVITMNGKAELTRLSHSSSSGRGPDDVVHDSNCAL